jgi:hypothetical protein
MYRPEWLEWGDTTPVHQAELLARAAGVSLDVARFTVNTIRVALQAPLQNIVPEAALHSLRPPLLWRMGVGASPWLFMEDELRELLDTVRGGCTTRTRWTRLSVGEGARAWQDAGLPAGEAETPVMMKHYRRITSVGGTAILDQYGRREELQVGELRQQYWPECSPSDWGFVRTVFEWLEGEEATPMGLFRPGDLLGMDAEELVGFSVPWETVERAYNVTARTSRWVMLEHHCSVPQAAPRVSPECYVHCCHTVGLVVYNALLAFGGLLP